MGDGMSHKLSIYFIMDNSPALSNNDLLDFLDGMNTVISNQHLAIQSIELHLAVYGYDGFEPIKLYDSAINKDAIESFKVHRFPLLGRTITLAAKDLYRSLSNVKEYHTPWVFIISSGLSVDSLIKSHHELDLIKNTYGLRYMPFLLNTRRYQNSNAIHDHFLEKKPLVIAEGKLPEFFNWFNDDITQRLAAPAAQGIKSNTELIQGWAVR
jgi:uncharacterized protein YegL